MSIVSNNCAATINYAKMITADIDKARFAERPAGLNSPAWIYLHLATTADYAVKLLGGVAVCPAEWNALADTKKPVMEKLEDYPPVDTLIGKFEEAYNHAAKLYDQLDSGAVSAPQQLGFFQQELPTVGDMAAFLLIGHVSVHLGQLSAWRRAIGKPALF